MLVCLCLLLAGGCSADTPLNPSFPLTLSNARSEWRAMKRDPQPLERPVIVMGGVHDPGFSAAIVASHLRRIASDDSTVLSVAFFTSGSFDACRERAIEAVEEALPSDDPEATVEVDVIGVSMGGLVARHACRPNGDGPRLKIRRLFTIATPHRGAKMAGLPTFDKRIKDMRRGSDFLSELDASVDEPWIEPEIYPYARLDDAIVGASNTAPPGQEPWWVANIPFRFAHLGAADDPRILADIARRLRGEPAYSLDPRTPLPGTDGTVASP
jgi:hypothetical protein